MNDEPSAQIEREVLGWDRVFKSKLEQGTPARKIQGGFKRWPRSACVT
jgi:hypothetical protein